MDEWFEVEKHRLLSQILINDALLLRCRWYELIRRHQLACEKLALFTRFIEVSLRQAIHRGDKFF